MDYHDLMDIDYLTELSALYEISSIPTSLISLEELGRLVLDKATRLMGTSIALLYRREGDGPSTLRSGRQAGSGYGRPLQFWAARGMPVAEVEDMSPQGEAIGRALDEGQPATLEGTDAVRAFGVLPASYSISQGLCLPIWAGASVRALLCAFRVADRPFTRTDVALFNALADRAGTALESIRLFAEMERRNRELQREITERKRAQEERERLLAELEAKNRELDSFVYTVSHDLRSPLVSLQGFSTRLLESYSDQLDERGQLYLERIQANTEHMGELLSDLLQLSRVGRVANPVEAVPLREVVDRLVQEWESRLEGVELEIAPDLPTVQGDRRRLEQVMANLLDNAVKFMGQQPGPRVEVGWHDEGEAYVIYVRDNGIGIDPRYHRRIFEIFQRLEEVKAEGTGVGLAIVKRIVEHHGGQVWVESEWGQGATFYFTLPHI